MTAIQLEANAIDYAKSALGEAGGLAEIIDGRLLHSPIIFAPETVMPDSFKDFDAGGVTTQLFADTDLANYLALQKRKDFSLCSLLFHDPWIELGDLRNLAPLPSEILEINKGVYYLHDMRTVSLRLIRDFRIRCISFRKLIYVSSMSTASLREVVKADQQDRLSSYVSSIKHVVVNACDGETWIVCRLSTG